MALARVLVAFVATAALAAGCGSSDETAPPLPTRAPPQEAELDWDERLPETGPALHFRVHRFEVTADGWKADVEIENRTQIPWRVGAESGAASFGVMLFPTSGLADVEQRSRDGELPGLRAARTFVPALPTRLARGGEWRGTMSAPGALAAGLYVRLVLGPFVAVGDPPEGMQTGFSWITDATYRLRG